MSETWLRVVVKLVDEVREFLDLSSEFLKVEEARPPVAVCG